MNKVGISTASLYPLHAEDAFGELAAHGVKTVEVFANSTSEAHEPYISMMADIAQQQGVSVCSLHPFSSPMESVFLFGTYDRRIEEMVNMYRGFFEGMNRLGAKIFVLHGAIKSSKCSTEHYMKQFRMLAEIGREYGITVAQENVCYCLSGELDFLKAMQRELGEYAKFVLDLKQARRSGADIFEYVQALGSDIIHCHVSDANAEDDCLPIGRGGFNFRELHHRLGSFGYSGSYIVELYRHNYVDIDELVHCADVLSNMIS